MKYLHVFTHDDLDGCACAVVARAMFADCEQRTLRYCQYNGPDGIDLRFGQFLDKFEKSLPDGEHVLVIADILPSKELCDRLDAMKGKFVRVAAFDHHTSTAPLGGKYDWLMHSEGACGATLLFESHPFFTEDMHHFVYAVDAWDRWLLDSKNRARGERLNLLFHELGFTDFLEQFSANQNADEQTWLKQLATQLEKRRTRILRSAFDRQVGKQPKIFKDHQGRKYLIVIAHDNVSELGNHILQEVPAIDYVVLLIPAINVASVRSRTEGKIDVGELAKACGGGGHKNSAGFPLLMQQVLLKLASALLGDR